MCISVILADDHAIVRQGLAALLQAEPDIVLIGQAADGDAAWRLIVAHQPDIAVLDLAMPQATGIDVARRIEAAALNTRVLLLTMYDDPAAVLEALTAQVAGYVLKDCSYEELVLGVRSIAAGGTFMTPVIRAKLRDLQRHGHLPIALSPRERDVIRLIAQGKSSKEIAQELIISPRTVDTYRSRLMDKLGLHTVADVVRWAVRGGMVG